MRIALISRRTLFTQPGGDTIHVQQTGKYLQKQGLAVSIVKAGTPLFEGEYDLLHFFNLTRPADFLPYVQLGIPYVISAIYIDYSAAQPFMGPVQKLLTRRLGVLGMEYAKTLARGILGRDALPAASYWLKGQKRAIELVLQNAAYVITASRAEASIIQKEFAETPAIMVLPLGVEHCLEHLPKGYPRKREGVLCVARFEPLKNQLSLIEAARQLKIKLTLVGDASAAHQAYYRACKQKGGDEVHFAGAANREQLAELYARHAVHVLPSFYETTGLSSLEALQHGCHIVVSDIAMQREIFADKAIYCQPGRVKSIKEALEKALSQGENRAASPWVKAHFSWEKAARELANLYASVVQGKGKGQL